MKNLQKAVERLYDYNTPMGDDARCEIAEFLENLTHAENKLTGWSNGSASVKWLNGDEVIVTSRYGTPKLMDGGDFEQFISAICYASEFKEG